MDLSKGVTINHRVLLCLSQLFVDRQNYFVAISWRVEILDHLLFGSLQDLRKSFLPILLLTLRVEPQEHCLVEQEDSEGELRLRHRAKLLDILRGQFLR